MKKLIFVVLILSSIGLSGWLFNNRYTIEQKQSVAKLNDKQETTAVTAEQGPNDSDPAILTSSTNDLLLYLIEEEKLAHDIYTKMYEKYGERVFGNILRSESTHQERVLTLLNARGVADPRSSEIGVFANVELQNLYNDLLVKGLVSEKDALEVGVIIEEKDIADIGDMLAEATDQDVIDILEDLRKGSENHLRAFNRQL
ncbi:MAG: DUF2202 domain-containing protein [Candidatus Saccharibacteria bacterium]|nr:DUF2202 domain-containing protein [Candidatus Saccharibacteria bacterium]